jgi:hypothetical protein
MVVVGFLSMRRKHNIHNSCPICGAPILEQDPGRHRCDSLAAVINNSKDSQKAADEFMRDLRALSKPDYSWIKVKKYVDDETLSWEERYKRLMKHHEDETKFLIDELNKLKNGASK